MTPILAYHAVSSRFDVGISRVSPKQFRKQIKWLHDEGYLGVTLASYLSGAGQQGTRRVVLTFDDGYASLDSAADTLSAYGFAGTAFVVTDFVGRSNTWDYRFFIRDLRHANFEQLQALRRAGWEIGSHSRRHDYLPGLRDAPLLADLCQSRRTLQQQLGATVTSISYPFGCVDQRVSALAGEAGYTCGVGLGLPLHRQRRLGMMCLPRLGVYLFDSPGLFARKIRAIERDDERIFALQQAISFCSRGTILLKQARSMFHGQAD